MSENIVTLTDATFEDSISKSPNTVIVDFWADWCGPCKKIAPILTEIAEEWEGKVTIAKLNVDENPETAQTFGVMSIPTMLVFRNGELDGRVVGAKPKNLLLAQFDI